MNVPRLHMEKMLWKQGFQYVAGVDEAGRGPLAGPVTAAAIMLRQNFKFQISNFKINPKSKVKNSKQTLVQDSKQLTAQQRENAYGILTTHPQIEWGIGIISEKIIDRVNILEATKLAIMAAVHDLQKKLGKAPDILLLDGNFTVDVPIAQKTFVKGDTFIFSCSAASIIAKVTRDRLMKQYHSKYPAYRFDSHKGYGTKLHYEMLNTYGPCPLHRKTFRPVYQLLNNLENPDIVKKHS